MADHFLKEVKWHEVINRLKKKKGKELLLIIKLKILRIHT